MKGTDASDTIIETPVETDDPEAEAKLSSKGEAAMQGVSDGAPEEPLNVEALSSTEKGQIGEAASVRQQELAGRNVLLAHPDNPHAPGFDSVAWDPASRRLVVGEAKFYKQGSSVGEQDLSAFREKRLDPNREEARQAISDSNLTKGEKISAQAQLRFQAYDVEIYILEGSKVSESAFARIGELSKGEARVIELDNRIVREESDKLRKRVT